MTILTKKLLIQLNACQAGIDFCEHYNLFGFDLNNLDQVKGDYNNFISWMRGFKNIEVDDNGNMTSYIKSNGVTENWTYEFYPNGQLKRLNDLEIPLI